MCALSRSYSNQPRLFDLTSYGYRLMRDHSGRRPPLISEQNPEMVILLLVHSCLQKLSKLISLEVRLGDIPGSYSLIIQG